MKQVFLKVIESTEESKLLGFYQLNGGAVVNECGESIGLYSGCIVQIVKL